MDVTDVKYVGRQGIGHYHIIKPFRDQRHPARQTGLSLLELVFTLSLMIIMLTLGLPMYKDMVGVNRLASQINHLSASLAYTRTEAVKRNQQVVLCKTHDGEACIRKGSWKQGWLVFVDNNQNERRDEDETILLHHAGFTLDVQMDYSAFGSRDYFVYRPSGTTMNNGTFVFCEQKISQGRALIINRVGRVRISEKTSKGKPIICHPAKADTEH